MKIAVVIPNYNSARIVQRAVEAMQRQRVPAGHSVQVVVADDGSTDGSADALASRFGDSITLLRQPENRGRSTTRNAVCSSRTASCSSRVPSLGKLWSGASGRRSPVFQSG